MADSQTLFAIGYQLSASFGEEIMPVLTLNNTTVSFGDFDLFVGLNASLHHGEKVGLVGPNGVGKTTLLMILAGIEEATHGGSTTIGGTRLGYLPQEAMDAFIGHDANTVWEEMLTVFAEVIALEAKLRDMEERMSDGDHSDQIMNAYGNAQHEFEHRGGYEYELDIERTLQGLGFSKDELQTPLGHLSGGQKTRALLARLLLEKPDLLILDEPTNHLDVDALQWLESALKGWSGALIIVSHDRYFLDRVVGTIWEMSRGSIETYKGNYTAYLSQRDSRYDHQRKTFEEEKERMLKEMDFIKRNWVRASTHDRALGRLRQLSRAIVAIEQLGVVAATNTKWSDTGIGKVRVMDVAEAEQRLKALNPPSNRTHRISMQLESKLRSGELVLRAHDLSIGYPGNALFNIDELLIERGETVALIGPNGSGKTTFLRTLLGQLEPLAGDLIPGTMLKLGYFAQARDSLDGSKTVLEELQRHREMREGEARKYLAQFLFRNDDVFKPVSALSGGERARLAMSILALEGANFLLLDEPTNHLDIPAQEVLQEVLEHFPGTVLLVSHDRYLIDRLATQIWAIKDGALTIFKGTYQQYLASMGVSVAEMNAITARHRQTNGNDNGKNGKESKAKRNEYRLAQLEAQIHTLEATLAKMGEDVQRAASGGKGYAHLNELSKQYQTTQRQLDAMIAEWSQLAG
jgi:ATP-binding cassette, subfamily F, member 3